MAVRDDLVRAGVELLERDGLAHLTLRSIARRTGVSHGAPRHHFPSYRDLLAAVARSGVDDLDADLTPALGLSDPREALRETARRYVEFATARPEMFELIGRHDLLAGAGGDLRATTGRWLASAGGRLREIDAGVGTTAVVALFAAVHGLAVVRSRRTAEAVLSHVPATDDVVGLLLDRLAGTVDTS